MITKRFLYPFIQGRRCLCPFCNQPLVERAGHTIKYCPRGGEKGPYCPYFFELKAIGQSQALNAIELTIHEAKCRVWIAKWKKIKVVKIGEHNHITCVLYPIELTNLQDMDKFINRIKTILTFQ